MCKNVQYWMRLYMARVIKGGLITVATGFLLFQCSDDSSKMDNKMDNPDNPDKSVIGKVIISENTLAFDDTAGATGGVYTISLSQNPAADKIVQVTLTSDNDALQIKPKVVSFTETTRKASQTIIVTRTAGASDVVLADITGVIDHTITSNADSDPNITTFQDGHTVGVTVSSTFVADSDSNGLIEIEDATMLNNMRYDLAGRSYKTSDGDVGDSSGCPTSGCKGYELMVDIDLKNLLNTGGDSGVIDTMPVRFDKNGDGDEMDTDDTVMVIDTVAGKDTSWIPIGDHINEFTGIFEGNGHTIANLWVNATSNVSIGSNAGLFGVTDGTVEIRNVGVISGSIHSSSRAGLASSGSLVGSSRGILTIINSYFSGFGGVSARAGLGSGGLVGCSEGTLTIINSYFSGSGGVSSHSDSGGLVGCSEGTLTIINSYFSGSGVVVSSTSSGGLIGTLSDVLNVPPSILKITNSYFSGSGLVSAFALQSLTFSGGLVGSSPRIMVMNSYWDIDAFQKVSGASQSPKRAQGNAETNPSNTTDLTLMQLQATSGTHPSDLPSGGTDETKAWDLGTDMQLPAIKRCVSPTVSSTNVVTCASYGALIKGQR